MAKNHHGNSHKEKPFHPTFNDFVFFVKKVTNANHKLKKNIVGLKSEIVHLVRKLEDLKNEINKIEMEHGEILNGIMLYLENKKKDY